MKKLLLISSLLFVFIGFFSCDEDKPIITTENIVGKWLVKDRAFGFTTDCERNEYIVFNADSTMVRQQCGQTTGTWYVENKKLIIDLQLDTTFVGLTYSSELLTQTKIKIKCVEKPYIWATYIKE